MRPLLAGSGAQRHMILLRILWDQVVALVQLADVESAAEDPPGVLRARVDLDGELVGFPSASGITESEKSQKTPTITHRQLLHDVTGFCACVDGEGRGC